MGFELTPEEMKFSATAAAKCAFDAFIAGIECPELRNRIEDSAMCNSFAVEVYDEYADDQQRWEIALSTAKDCADCPRDYYPELDCAA